MHNRLAVETKEIENEILPILYQLHKVDDAAFPHFYMYLSAMGGYYLIKEDSSGNLLYFKNEFTSSGRWADAWANRAVLNYSAWDTFF